MPARLRLAGARLTHIWLYQLASSVFSPALPVRQQGDCLGPGLPDGLFFVCLADAKILAALVTGSIGSPLSAIEAIRDG